MTSELILQKENQYEFLLSLIQKIEAKVDSQIINHYSNILPETAKLQEQYNSLSIKFDSISNQFTNIKCKTEKIDDFSSFTSKANDLLTTHEIRINNVTKDLSNAKYKYDKMFLDNLVVPGFIGDFCKYKNLKEYLDANIKDMSVLINYKEKTSLDLKEYKEKIEGFLREYQRQSSLLSSQQQAKCDEVKKEAFAYVDQCKAEFFNNNDQLQLKNSKYYAELKEKTNQLNCEWNKITNMKEEINKHFDETVNEIKLNNAKATEELKIYHEEFNQIKNKFAELIEFIKDVRFRKNLVSFEEVKKREITQLSNKLKFNNSRRKSVESLMNPKQIDLKYDFFTGKDGISSDEERSKIKKKNIRNKQGAIPLIDNVHMNTIDCYDNSDQRNKAINQCVPITEDPFDSSPQLIKPIKAPKDDNGIILLKSEFLFEEIPNDTKENANQRSPKRRTFYNDSKGLNINSANVNSFSQDKLVQMSSMQIDTNPNQKSLKNTTSTPKLPIHHQKRHSYFNNKIPHQVEGKIVTLHFKEVKPSNEFNDGNYNRDKIDVLLKPTELNRKDSKRFKTVKESDQLMKRLYLSGALQDNNTKPKERTESKDTKNKKDIIDCKTQNQLHYEPINKVITNNPKTKI